MTAFTIPPETTLRELLTAIDNWLPDHAARDHRRDLWYVLTALRGPDTDDPDGTLKRLTVALRTKAFPRYALNCSHPTPLLIDPPIQPYIERIEELADDTAFDDDGRRHFLSHLLAGFRILLSHEDKEVTL